MPLGIDATFVLKQLQYQKYNHTIHDQPWEVELQSLPISDYNRI